MASPFECDTKRLTLPGGEWIEIRTVMSIGDVRRMRRILAGSDDPVLFGMAQLFVRIAAWSFRDDAGKVADVTEAAFDALSFTVARQMRDAVDQWEAAEEREKNGSMATDGESNSAATSPSAA